jgi:hypothetical protein
MAGLVPAIHVFLNFEPKTWMPGTGPGMTISSIGSAYKAHPNSAR